MPPRCPLSLSQHRSSLLLFSPRPALSGPPSSVGLRAVTCEPRAWPRTVGPSSVEPSAPRSDDGRDCDHSQHRRAAQEEGVLLQRGGQDGGEDGTGVQVLLADSDKTGQQLATLVLPLPHSHPPGPGRLGIEDGADAELGFHDHGHLVRGGAGVARDADAVGAEPLGRESSQPWISGEELRG